MESDNNNLSKHSLLSPLKTLTKLGKTLTLPKNNKNDGTPQFTKELISSPMELRYSFTPIVDPEKPKLIGRPRSSSASNVKSQTTLPSEHIDNHEGKNNKDNTDKNIDKDLSAENIENENNNTKTTQNITIEKNDYNLVNNSSQNNQNTETGEIEVIVTSNNSNNDDKIN